MEQKQPVRLVVTDMDGTLLNSRKEISPRFFRLMDYMHQEGIRLAVATGRQWSDIAHRFEKYIDGLLFAGSNGTVITEGRGIIRAYPAPKETLLAAVELLRKVDGVCPLLCGVERMFTDRAGPWLYEKGGVYAPGVVELEDVSRAFEEEEILKISVFHRDEGALPRTIELLRCFEDTLELLPSGTDWLETQLRGASKGNAVRVIQETFGISFEETAIFADYLNDMSMMDRGYYSYAMKNAHLDIKAAARFVTEYTNDEDGVAETLIELFGLQKGGL